MHRDKAFPTPAIVMLTSTFGQRQHARAAGIDVYMTKPVRRDRLQHALAEALGRRTQREQLPAHTSAATASSPIILIAEDNDINQSVAVQMLERRGYRTEIAQDGLAVLTALRRRTFAAVLMDCQMPEINGYDTTRELRRREDGDRHIPVIAMTAHALRGDRERCLASGMDDYLSKPLRPEELDRILTRWVPRTGRGSGAIKRLSTRPTDGRDPCRRPARPCCHRSLAFGPRINGDSPPNRRIVRRPDAGASGTDAPPTRREGAGTRRRDRPQTQRLVRDARGVADGRTLQ